MTKIQRSIFVVLVLIASLWEFSGVLTAGFVHQDNNWQTANYGQPSHIITSRATTRWTWWAQQKYTPAPASFHFVNLCLHIFAAFLVVLLVKRLGASEIGVWFAGIVFLLNPIQVEAFTYVSSRTELFSLIGVLSACLFLTGEITFLNAVAAFIAIIFGLLSKESSIVIFALIPIIYKEWYSSLVALILLAISVTLFARGLSFPIPNFEWAFIQITAAWRMINSTILTIGQTVDFDYDNISPLMQLVSVILLVTGCIYAWTLRHSYPLVTIGMLWVVAIIIPRSIVVTPLSNFNEHQFYSAMPGVSLIFAGVTK